MLSNCGAGEDTQESLGPARRSNQLILKEINAEYSLEWLMLKFQYFGHLMWRADSLEKTLMLGKTEGKRRSGQQRMRWLDIIDTMDVSLSKLWEIVKYREAWRSAVHGVSENQMWLSNWTTIFILLRPFTKKKISVWEWEIFRWEKPLKEQIWKAAREKQQIPHQGIAIRITADLSIETLQARREWQEHKVNIKVFCKVRDWPHLK